MDLLGWIRTASKKRKRRPDCHCNLAVRSPTHAFHHHFQVPQLIFSGCHQVQAILGEFSVKSTSINTAQPGLVKKTPLSKHQKRRPLGAAIRCRGGHALLQGFPHGALCDASGCQRGGTPEEVGRLRHYNDSQVSLSFEYTFDICL